MMSLEKKDLEEDKYNILAYEYDLFEEDLEDFTAFWKERKFCEDIKILIPDNFTENQRVIVFENCNIETIAIILNQCPYLVLTINEDEFTHTGVDLNIEFILTQNWEYQI